MVDCTRDQGEYDFRGRWRFCSILVFHVCDMLSSRLIFMYFRYLCLLLDCLRVAVDVFEVVVEIFEVAVGSFRWF